MNKIFAALLLSTSFLMGIDTPQIVVIRHAQAQHNIDQTLNSNPKHEAYRPSYLTRIGEKEAKITAELLLEKGINADTVSLTLVSPLPRATQTATLLSEQGVLAHKTIVIDQRLSEKMAGDHEGSALDMANDKKAKHYDAEKEADVLVRVREVLKDVGSRGLQGHVVIITHAVPAKEIIKMMTGEARDLATSEAVIIPMNSTKFLYHK